MSTHGEKLPRDILNQLRFPQRSVYLAGPITGLSYGEARHGWRDEIAALLPPHIHSLSPMRAKEFLQKEQVLRGDPNMYPENVMASPRGIISRDENDLRQCDAMIACFLGAQAVSIGTCCELGMARILRKPVVLVMEQDGLNPHSHAFITEIQGYWVETLEEAAHCVTHLLTPGR